VIFCRRFCLLVMAAALTGWDAIAARAAPAPEATATALYAALLQVMKILDPELRRDLNLPLMTRLVVGPVWRSLPPAEQQRLIEAFSDYSIAVYAGRFKDYSGERFVVDPATTPLANGDVIVHTKLVPADGEAVQLDYLMRGEAAGWMILDVFLSGTISELATRRSEYSSILRDGGAAALVRLLKKKTAELGS